MAGDVLREFLVSVGYRVDGGSEAKAVSSAARVERAVVGADKRVTDAQGVGSARRILQAGREAGIRTRGAAQLIAETKRVAETDAKHTQETIARSKDRERADKDAATASHGRSTAFVTATLAMAAAAAYAATRIGTALVQIAGNMEQVYYSSQRTKSSAANLRAFGYAAGQMGSSAGEANASLEALAKNMRSSPGYASMLNGLGVATETNGQLRDTVDVVQDLGGVLAKMPGFQAKAYADALGIDEKTLTALKSGEFTKHVAEYRDMLDKARLNPEKAAKDSAAFMNVWRRMQTGLEIIGTRIEGALVGRFGGSVTKFTDWLLKNSDRIADGVIRIGETILRLVGRVADLFGAFDRLDPATKGFIVQLGAMGAALMLLRAGPLGVILALGTGILALYDDFRKWKEGGTDTLIDWAKWEPAITSALKAFKDIWEGFDAVAKKLTGQDGLTVAFIALGTVLALNVLAPLGKIMTLLTGFGALRLPPWLLGLLGVAGLAGVANANGILGTGEAGQGLGERALRTLDPGLGDRVYGQSGADRAADAKDGRNLWQKYAPKWLGGKDAPNGSRTIDGSGGTRSGGSRSWRNNNPGNLKFSDATKAMGATHADDKGFAVFPDEATGRKAQEGLLFDDPRYKGKTLAQAMQQYAPSSENDTQGYIGAIAKAAGITGDTPLGDLTPQQRNAMLDVMKRHEGWQEGSTTSGRVPGSPKGFANLMFGQHGAPGENLTSISTPSGKKVTVHKAAAESFAGFLKDLEGSGYDIGVLQGYANRGQANGSGRISQHAYGNAIDINPSKNPYKTSITDMPKNVSEMAAKWGLSWGGDWSERSRDPMHFEWAGAQPWKNKAGPEPTPENKPAPMPFGLDAKSLEAIEKHREAIPKIEGALQRFDNGLGKALQNAPKVVMPESAPLGSQSVTNANRNTTITAPQSNTYHINGASDPKAVGAEVGKTQTRVHADLLRNLQGNVA